MGETAPFEYLPEAEKANPAPAPQQQGMSLSQYNPGEQPPPYTAQAYPGGQVASGHVQYQHPGQITPQQPGHVQYQHPDQITPQQPVVQYGQPASTVVVIQPGSVSVAPTPPAPASYMATSIIGCMFCFWPIGVGAIVTSCSLTWKFLIAFLFPLNIYLITITSVKWVQSAVARGDITSAQRLSRIAKLVNIINFATGSIIILIILALSVEEYQ